MMFCQNNTALLMLSLLPLMLCVGAALLTPLRDGVRQPYKPLQGGFRDDGPRLSPDPLSSFFFDDVPSPAESTTIRPLQTYALRPVAVSTNNDTCFRNAESLASDSPDVTVAFPCEASLRLDFGVESAAWFEFDSPDLHRADPSLAAQVSALLPSSEAFSPKVDDETPPPLRDNDVVVNVTVSENTHREPNKTAAPVPVSASIDARGEMMVTYRLRTSKEWYEGTRYAFIDVSTTNTSHWRIVAARLVCQVRPTNYVGSFATSDPVLTQLWAVGAYTVKVALLAGDDDGAIASELMDRGDRQDCNYGGYGQPLLRTLYAAFGEYALADRFNNVTATWQHDSDIMSYWLYWAESVLDWYDRTGNETVLRAYVPSMRQRLDVALDLYTQAAANGTAPIKMFGDDDRLGFEFEAPNVLPEPQLAYRMVVLRTLRRFATVMLAINETDVGRQYGSEAERLIEELRSEDLHWTHRLGVHSGADAASAGFMTLAEQRDLVSRGVFSNPRTLPSWSAFNGWYLLRGLDALNDTDAALDLARTTWGGNVAAGATCYWERFDPQWLAFTEPGDPPAGGINDVRTSECHAWSSGVTAWLTESVLGVRPTSPGFRHWDAVPLHFFGTSFNNLTWVHGSVPTPLAGGPAAAWFDVAAGRHGVAVPAGTVARVGVPRMETGLASVAIDGSLVWQNESSHHRARTTAGFSCAEEATDVRFLFCSVGVPGKHDVTVEYVQQQPRTTTFKNNARAAAASSAIVARVGTTTTTATFAGLDNTTSGDWVGRFGEQGYVLFGYGSSENVAKTTNLTKLPSFVSSVVPLAWSDKPALVVAWNASTADPRALAPPAPGTTPGRRVAARITSKKQASLTVDVFANATSAFNVSLYCVDFGRDLVAQNVRVMKLTSGGDNLDVLTEIVALPARSFDDGVYLTYRVDCSGAAPSSSCGSLRFRIFEMYDPAVPFGYPPKPVLSGLFFDS